MLYHLYHPAKETPFDHTKYRENVQFIIATYLDKEDALKNAVSAPDRRRKQYGLETNALYLVEAYGKIIAVFNN